MKVVLYTAKKKGDGQLERETPFMYGHISRPDYEDTDSVNLLAIIDCCHDMARREPMTLCYMGRALDHYTIHCNM